MNAAAAIRTEGLTKRYGSITALDGLTLQVEVGEVFGFLGPNGAGKSTTLRLLLGLIRATAGQAWILGEDVRDVQAVHPHLAYVPGDVNLWPKLTGAECLEVLARFHGAVDVAYRDELVERFELDTAKRARTYSKGNRQKVSVVAAFATRAEVLLLDEPTSGLDPLMEAKFRLTVQEASVRGQTVFLSSHILSEVQRLCARVGILRKGQLVEVAPIERLRQLRRTVLDIDFDGRPPDLGRVPGVLSAEPTPGGLKVTLSGPPGPLLKALAKAKVMNLRSEEASLEEIFLGYYDDAATPTPTSTST
ncbi:MAG: ATP-binding cassette domain-containing protein [Acidimicrobiales bacterium]